MRRFAGIELIIPPENPWSRQELHTRGFVTEMRRIGVTPHVAQNTSCQEGYAKSINARHSIEKVSAWIKQWGGLRQFKLRSTKKVSAVFGLLVIACSMIRVGNLLKPEIAVA